MEVSVVVGLVVSERCVYVEGGGGLSLLSRIHFPPDHNAIMVGPGFIVPGSARTHTANTSYSV